MLCCFCVFKQKTAYELRISDWSSDVCSSDLIMRLRIMERSSVDLMDVLAFVRVVETGAFARAAERMGMSKSILSRRVARLEEQLGAKLLTRTAQGAHPTDIGDAYFARASNILADLDAAREVVADAVTQV